MPGAVKKRSSKAGIPPGTLIHIGEKRSGEVKITLLRYNEIAFEEKGVNTVDECIPLGESPTTTWIDIEGIHDVGFIENLGKCYGFHPLVLEDILNTDQRPKVEDYGGYLYIVLKMLYLNHKSGKVVTEQTSIILGQKFVLSFQEGFKGDVFDHVRERIRNGKGKIRALGADYLAYSLIDAVVDGYFAVLEKLGEDIEVIESDLVLKPIPRTLQMLHHVKREVIFLRKATWPLREVVSALERGESSLVKGSTRTYLRDVYDHTIQVIDTIETYRDILSGMLDIYLSSMSNRLNEVMKVLTIIATIFMPLTFIAGVYGMNFTYMPELKWRWGYPLILLLMLAVGILMLVYFKRKKWL